MIQFKDLKEGHPVYFLETAPSLSVSVGRVINVTQPHFEPSQYMKTSQMPIMIVDVTIENDGKASTYSIPESSSVTYAGQKLMLATEKEGIVREVEAIRDKSRKALEGREQNEKTLAEAEKIITEWNPEYKEKKQTEQRFVGIEKQLNDLSAKFDTLLNKLS